MDKFDTGLTEILYNLSMDGISDDEGGDVDGLNGWNALFLDVADYVNDAVWNADPVVVDQAKVIIRSGDIPQAAIINQDDQGFVSILRFPTNEAAEDKFSMLVDVPEEEF